MEYQALRFEDPDRPTCCTLSAETAEDILEIRKGRLPVVYLLADDAIDRFIVYPALIRDRGTKHKKKSLSDLLLGYDRICMIRGSYEGTRQLVRSCNDLLKKARILAEQNAFLIFIPDSPFLRLWNRTSGSGTRVRDAGGSPDPGVPSGLPGMHPIQEVPAELSESYLGHSEDVRLVRQLILVASRCENPILILGESGTGKEIAARSIHQLSIRRNLRFEAVNCGALPTNLLESILFGHKKGAFTDAKRDKKGSWELAGKGTLFLDEIGDLSLENQVKILRVLSSGRIRPLGADEDVAVHAHVIAATNRDLFSMVQAGQFREDLYYRLRSFLIFTPALRNHPDDIPLMAQNFWRKITRDDSARLPASVLTEMKAYPWYGNGREMKNLLSLLYGLFGTVPLGVEHFRAVYRYQRNDARPRKGALDGNDLSMHRAECLQHLKRTDEVLREVQVSVQPHLRRTGRAPADARTTVALIENRIYELETLCLHPVLFVHPELYQRIRDFSAELVDLVRHLRKSSGGVKAYWARHLDGPCQETQRMVFREVGKLMRTRK
jgi:DNA-binding NtrC family response regulator